MKNVEEKLIHFAIDLNDPVPHLIKYIKTPEDHFEIT